uniref:Smr domain-containing protein n=1 Tax=Anopheles farauti TaxID=69004 RepID=A0A182QDH2_9DIPT
MCRDEILAQLTELFGDYIEQQRIVATIEKHEELNACIEALLKEEGQMSSSSSSEQQQQAVVDAEVTIIPTDNVPNGPDPSTGATRKMTSASTKTNHPPEMPPSFASLVQKGSFPSQVQQPAPSYQRQGRRQKPAEQPENFQTILDMVAQGYRVMVLMRGVPGSGKSYLARTLVDRTSGGDYRNHIFSTDDYFMVNGVYKFQPDALDAAHRFNQQNVQSKARDGWSPIVVDNTHVQLWEMFAYVHIAADHGYYLEVLEPTTHWKTHSRSLAIRNTHGVPEPKIKSMLQKFEKLTSVQELYRACKLEHALYIPAKMRHYPIVSGDLFIPGIQPAQPEDQTMAQSQQRSFNWTGNWEDITKASKDTAGQASRGPAGGAGGLSAIPPPKPPRDPQKTGTPVKRLPASVSHTTAKDDGDVGAAGGGRIPLEDDFSWDFTDDWRNANTNWKPYDTESNQFWGQTEKDKQKTDPLALEAQPQRSTNPQYEPITEFLISSVKQPTKIPEPPKSPALPADKTFQKKATDKKRIALTKHKRGCVNENASFSEICNLYPKVPEAYLWDLFEKCSGDGDWVANLLLEEQKFENFESAGGTTANTSDTMTAVDALTQTTTKWNLLECNCNEPVAKAVPAEGSPSLDAEHVSDAMVPSSNKPLSGYSSTQSPRETMQRPGGRGQLRESVQAAKREIEARFVVGNEHFSEPIQKLRLARRIVPAEESPPGELMDVDGPAEKATDSEVVELRLGVELVQQLHAIFKDKHCPKSLELDDLNQDRTRVFMATETAEQLYLLFLDSLYSYTEEEKLFSLREDARMAQLMQTEEKYPALFKPTDPSGVPNLKDIIEMEQALAAYQKETNASWQKSGQLDLAQQMSHQKLKEMFPHVNGDDLVQILAAHNNRFDETVQVLNASIPETVRKQMLEQGELLKQQAENEQQKLLDLVSAPEYGAPSPTGSARLSGEEAINFHIMKAEECRNLAQHHLDLKNECHEKARQAIQRKVPGLADYYSQIARLHRTKIDMYNNRASNYIMEVHKLKLNNIEVLDLHYLHSAEALRCLELFLAEHAENLLNSQQRFKTLYIITGRGLHSADGKPIIKQRVKAMLREKNIRYNEVNPGYLKIKLNNRDDLEQLFLTTGPY